MIYYAEKVNSLFCLADSLVVGVFLDEQER